MANSLTTSIVALSLLVGVLSSSNADNVELKVKVSDMAYKGPSSVTVTEGHQVDLICLHQGYNRNRKEIEWYLGEGKLQTKNCNGPYASCRKLSLPGLTLESSGHWFYCKGTELKEASWASVQINVTGAAETKVRSTVCPFPEITTVKPEPPTNDFMFKVLGILTATVILMFAAIIVFFTVNWHLQKKDQHRNSRNSPPTSASAKTRTASHN